MEISEICRICLEIGEMKPIFTTNCLSHLQMSCAEAIVQLYSVTARENDGLPKHICKKCLSKLKSAFKFKILCENSFTRLTNQIPQENNRKLDDFISEEISINNVNSQDDISDIKVNPSDVKDEETVHSHLFDLNYCENEPGNELELESKTVIVKTEIDYSCNDNFSKELDLKHNTEVNLAKTEVVGCCEEITHAKHKKFKKSRKKSENSIGDKILNETLSHTQKQYQCCMCEKSFHSKHSLKKHEQRHLGTKGYFCDICQKAFRSDSHGAVHCSDRRLQCEVCPREFLRPRALKAHLLSHQGPLPFRCLHPGCGKAFPINSRLQLHLKVHTDERNFICQYCSHAARDKQQLNTHIRYYHTKEKNFLCGSCGKAFVSPQARYYHAKRHENVRNHHCPHCDKSFVFAFGLQEHLVTHTGERRFPCSLCESRFSRKAHREKHEASVHGIHRPPSKRPPMRDPHVAATLPAVQTD